MDLEGNGSMEASESKGGQEVKQSEAVTCVGALQERESSMEVIEERKVQEDQSESSVATDKGCMCKTLVSLLSYL